VLSKGTPELCTRMVNKRLQEVNAEIARKTDDDPDVVDTQWFDDKQANRAALVEANHELHTEITNRKVGANHG
jgi:hypothetical protein